MAAGGGGTAGMPMTVMHQFLWGLVLAVRGLQGADGRPSPRELAGALGKGKALVWGADLKLRQRQKTPTLDG